MLSLIYVSTAKPGLCFDAVEALATRAAAANFDRSITGLLAYNTRSFMQLLEGEAAVVRETMNRIARDPRHHDIIYVRQDRRERRECPDWSMRAIMAPLTGMGAAEDFTRSLPADMDFDTRILFTSFASSLAVEAA